MPIIKLSVKPMHSWGRKRRESEGRKREDSEERKRRGERERAGCVRVVLLLKSDGRRWRTLRANLFRQGKRPWLVVDDVYTRAKMKVVVVYDQVIPLSELSAARGYLQSQLCFAFFFRGAPHLLASRLVTPSRSHRNEYMKGPRSLFARAPRLGTERNFFSHATRQSLTARFFIHVSVRSFLPLLAPLLSNYLCVSFFCLFFPSH